MQSLPSFHRGAATPRGIVASQPDELEGTAGGGSPLVRHPSRWLVTPFSGAGPPPMLRDPLRRRSDGRQPAPSQETPDFGPMVAPAWCQRLDASTPMRRLPTFWTDG